MQTSTVHMVRTENDVLGTYTEDEYGRALDLVREYNTWAGYDAASVVDIQTNISVQYNWHTGEWL